MYLSDKKNKTLDELVFKNRNVFYGVGVLQKHVAEVRSIV